MALTKKQKEVYDYIQSYFDKNGFSPTQKEIKDHFGLKSFGSVNRYIKYLNEAELIELDWNARRGIKLVSKDTQTKSESSSDSDVTDIPLLGDVAAGIPIEAIENCQDFITVPNSMIRKSGKIFALNVKGDSMINDGILEGDYLICKHQSTANLGQTVIAIVNNEATVKRYHKKKSHIELIAANENYAPIIVGPEDDFHIAGLVVGLFRQYE